MDRKAALTLGLLAVLSGFFNSTPTWAQSTAVPSSCSSPLNTNEKSQTPDEGEAVAHRKVIVDRIEFDRPVKLSSSDVEQIVNTANEVDFDADVDSHPWLDQMAEIGLRGAWLNQGYFKITLTAQAQPLWGDSEAEHFLVAVHVENEGPQFHLGDVRFTGGTGIPESELRQVIPLQEGEIFSVEKVRESIRALTKFYGSHGYIDFTVDPETEDDENLQRISLNMRLDEQKQFHVGSVEIRGLEPSLEARLRSIIVPGNVVDMEPIDAFFKENQSALPPRGIENLRILRNVRLGIADFTFDPQPCPEPRNQQSTAQVASSTR